MGIEVSARIGPFIALGNPVDFVPPEGAARTYVADDEWTKHFEEMVRRARCIVLMAATSDHVLWELAQIRLMGLQQRLFVLTKPKLVRKTRAVAWNTFAAALRQAGYQPCGEDPGTGGHRRVQRRRPSGYIEARHEERGGDRGRVVQPSRTSACGRRIAAVRAAATACDRVRPKSREVLG